MTTPHKLLRLIAVTSLTLAICSGLFAISAMTAAHPGQYLHRLGGFPSTRLWQRVHVDPDAAALEIGFRPYSEQETREAYTKDVYWAFARHLGRPHAENWARLQFEHGVALAVCFGFFVAIGLTAAITARKLGVASADATTSRRAVVGGAP